MPLTILIYVPVSATECDEFGIKLTRVNFVKKDNYCTGKPYFSSDFNFIASGDSTY